MKTSERIEKIGIVVVIGFIAFLLGQAVSYFKLPTSGFLSNAFSAIEAIKLGWEDFGTEGEAADYIGETRIHNAANMSNGLTLLIETGARSLNTAEIRLVHADGEIEHTWTVPWDDIEAEGWPETAGGGVPMSTNTVYPRATHLYPNGDLLILLHARGRTPFGVAMAKIDIDSNLIWTYNKWAHHDIDIGEDGNIYTLSHELKIDGNDTVDMMQTLNYDIMVGTPYIDDTVEVLSPEGEELISVSITEALGNSEFVPLFGVAPPDEQGDHLHVNSIQVVTPALAAQIPFAEVGNVLVSARTLHALILIDLETELVTWVGTGNWRYQHDANFLANGNIQFLDNIGGTTHTGGATQITELNPVTGDIEWQYQGTEEFPLNTRELGEVQRLANGNVLISATQSGRIVEVTQDKEVVWEYLGSEF